MLCVGHVAAQHDSTTAGTAQPVGVTAVDSVGMTVSDMERAIHFYTSVLSFEKISDVEVADAHELLTGVFGARMRVVRVRLGDEIDRADRVPGAKGAANAC